MVHATIDTDRDLSITISTLNALQVIGTHFRRDPVAPELIAALDALVLLDWSEDDIDWLIGGIETVRHAWKYYRDSLRDCF